MVRYISEHPEDVPRVHKLSVCGGWGRRHHQIICILKVYRNLKLDNCLINTTFMFVHIYVNCSKNFKMENPENYISILITNHIQYSIKK